MTNGITKESLEESSLSWHDYQTLDQNLDNLISAHEIHEAVKVSSENVLKAVFYFENGGVFAVENFSDAFQKAYSLFYDVSKNVAVDSQNELIENAFSVSRELYRNPNYNPSYHTLKYTEQILGQHIDFFHAHTAVDSEAQESLDQKLHAHYDDINTRHKFEKGDSRYRICHPDLEIHVLRDDTLTERVEFLENSGHNDQAYDVRWRGLASVALYNYRDDVHDYSKPLSYIEIFDGNHWQDFLQHELAHEFFYSQFLSHFFLISSGRSCGGLNEIFGYLSQKWLQEGFSEWFSGQDQGNQILTYPELYLAAGYGMSLEDVDFSHALTGYSRGVDHIEYLRGAFAFEFLQTRFGEEVIWELMAALQQGKSFDVAIQIASDGKLTEDLFFAAEKLFNERHLAKIFPGLAHHEYRDFFANLHKSYGEYKHKNPAADLSYFLANHVTEFSNTLLKFLKDYPYGLSSPHYLLTLQNAVKVLEEKTSLATDEKKFIRDVSELSKVWQQDYSQASNTFKENHEEFQNVYPNLNGQDFSKGFLKARYVPWANLQYKNVIDSSSTSNVSEILVSLEKVALEKQVYKSHDLQNLAYENLDSQVKHLDLVLPLLEENSEDFVLQHFAVLNFDLKAQSAKEAKQDFKTRLQDLAKAVVFIAQNQLCHEDRLQDLVKKVFKQYLKFVKQHSSLRLSYWNETPPEFFTLVSQMSKTSPQLFNQLAPELLQVSVDFVENASGRSVDFYGAAWVLWIYNLNAHNKNLNTPLESLEKNLIAKLSLPSSDQTLSDEDQKFLKDVKNEVSPIAKAQLQNAPSFENEERGQQWVQKTFSSDVIQLVPQVQSFAKSVVLKDFQKTINDISSSAGMMYMYPERYHALWTTYKDDPELLNELLDLTKNYVQASLKEISKVSTRKQAGYLEPLLTALVDLKQYAAAESSVEFENIIQETTGKTLDDFLDYAWSLLQTGLADERGINRHSLQSILKSLQNLDDDFQTRCDFLKASGSLESCEVK